MTAARSLHRLSLPTLLGLLVGCGCRAAPPAPGDLESLKADPNVFAGVPRAGGAASNFTLLRNRGYAVGYSEARRNPLWAAYRLTRLPEHPPPGPRPSRFLTDPRTAARVGHDDYTKSGYDRGHMAPNYAIATRFGQEAQVETFLMSNICPQTHALNAGLWACLEEIVADCWANEYQEVWVLVGPIFGPAPGRLPAGVEIPDAFFMIVAAVIDGGPKVMAFVMTQEIPSGRPLSAFLTSVRSVEQATGLDFFSDLEDALEEQLETAVGVDVWRVSDTWLAKLRGQCKAVLK
jgi:endonuclease G